MKKNRHPFILLPSYPLITTAALKEQKNPFAPFAPWPKPGQDAVENQLYRQTLEEYLQFHSIK